MRQRRVKNQTVRQAAVAPPAPIVLYRRRRGERRRIVEELHQMPTGSPLGAFAYWFQPARAYLRTHLTLVQVHETASEPGWEFVNDQSA